MTPEDLALVIEGAAKVSDAAMRELRTPGVPTCESDSRNQWEALTVLASGVELLARRAQDEMAAQAPVVRPCPVCAEDEDLCPHRQARTILALPLGPNDADATTVRDYLICLLATLWAEGEGFDGKRPWGNSSWTMPVELAMVQAGMVPGEIDPEEGWLDEVDTEAVDALVQEALEYMSAGG